MTIVAHLWRAIQDKRTGRLVTGATVSLCTPGTETTISDPLFSDVGLTQPLSNPFTSSTGIIDVYLGAPVTVQVKVSYGSAVDLADNIAILPLADEIVITESPFSITNAPGTGLFLTGIDAQTAEFADLSETLAGVSNVVLGWFLSQSLQFSSIVRDANGAMTSADIVWPDGISGVYSADTISSLFPGKVDAWNVTRETTPTAATYTQPLVTRDDNGDITAMPTVVVT